jgi:hypothetical protein
MTRRIKLKKLDSMINEIDCDETQRRPGMADRRDRYLAACAKNKTVKKGQRTLPGNTHGKYFLSGGMLVCPTCGGFFEGRKNPWRPRSKKVKALLGPVAPGHGPHVYICSTRRRKPGVCTNTLALPIEETDNTVLEIVADEVLCKAFVKELLALVKHAPDETMWLTAERERLQKEIDRLVASIASGVPPETVAPLIQTKRSEIRKLERRLNAPRGPRLDHDQLRAALEQRIKEWKAQLCKEPSVGRLLLRRLVGPITLFEEAPEWCRFETVPRAELLDGLTPTLEGTSPNGVEDFYRLTGLALRAA